MAEREALLEFFDVLSGEWWKYKWNWESEQRLSKWFGILVNTSAHVDALQLSENGLRGDLNEVSMLQRLVNIRILCLSMNCLVGSIPASISTLNTLVHLDLSWNQFTGK